ncbi:MAG: 2-isopropylmalate synthase [Gemmatimonadetes bacterium]|nr:2-isopropylmalate synthase [Gemmatimonadota bacterium]
MDNRVVIFDTTLRDGEQSPGASMTPAEKLRIAHALDELGVDVIEAGFPISSPDDFVGVQKIAKEVRRPVVAGLARARREDIERAAAAVEHAERPRIHTFIATSKVHLESKLKITEEECVEQAIAAVELARRYTDDVEFSAEDATRTDLAFLQRVVRAAIGAGATTINLPDTVGYTLPTEITRMFRTLIEGVPELSGVVLSAHCHDDLGLAVANSLAALEAGARQVECTVNGIGERAGNAALEEIVMSIAVRKDLLGLTTGIHTRRIHPTSRLLSQITGIHPQPNKAIVGRNAFAHEAGIHQDGMLKERRTYEIMDPAMVGVHGSELVLGKHSGRHALSARFKELGYELAEEELERAYRLFKLLANQKKDIRDEDLLAIIHHGTMRDIPDTFRLERMRVECGGEWSHATIVIKQKDAAAVTVEGKGDGPIAAAFDGVNQVVGWSVELVDLTIRAATPGRDAVGEVSLRIAVDGKTFSGRAASTDVVDAAVRGYLHALNKAAHARSMGEEALQKSADIGGV